MSKHTLVLSVSSLQGLHRGGVFARLAPSVAGGWFIPGAVEAMTREARSRIGARRVPNLDELGWLPQEPVSDLELAALGVGEPEGTRYQYSGMFVSREALEVVALARRLGATAVFNEHDGLSFARLVGVATLTLKQAVSLLAPGDENEVAARMAAEEFYLLGQGPERADRYDPTDVETKWQRHWDERGLFKAGARPGAEKLYVLEMLPYPSGEMHMGHVRNYVLGDVIARHARMAGKDVLHPLGWDSFGLPAENAAIKDGRHPAQRTPENIASFKKDCIALGLSYDWSRELATSQPEYYRWNQWFFLKMLERGIVYRRRAKVNWCPKDRTVLANEQVEDGKCWRCGSVVEQREIPEWAFRITKYADELLAELANLQWPERVLSMQKNWLGRSEGAYLDFQLVGRDEKLRVFTTRADTAFGATYVVLAPEHELAEEIATPAQEEAVQGFQAKTARLERAARLTGTMEKEGVFTGAFATNPMTGQPVPVWLANFVVADYGTGAVMSVPAHDQRDFEFAKKYDLPIRQVVNPQSGTPLSANAHEWKEAYSDDGVLVNSGAFTGLTSAEARARLATDVAARGLGEATVTWHLRDWGISRQRYWGTPIPIVYCENCDPQRAGIPVPYDQLPVELPDIDVKEVLTGEGEPPLAKVKRWYHTTCPRCGGPATREPETMDTFVDSSWYFARYLSPHDAERPFERAEADRWLPVDVYVGGPEHAVMHLLYFRFWTKVMSELGLTSVREPVRRLITQGIVKGRDGEKMSKSKGNVVSPRELIGRYGADVARLFILFAGPPEKDMDWSDEQVEGQSRFLQRVWRLVRAHVDGPEFGDAADAPAADFRRAAHKTLKKVTGDLPNLGFNTAIAAVMELVNALYKLKPADAAAKAGRQEALELLAVMLAPFAPHFAEETWRTLGRTEDLAVYPWPAADAALLTAETLTYAVQVNGKLRAQAEVPAGADEAQVRAAAEVLVAAHLAGKTVKKVVFVPKRLISFVVA